MFFVRAFFVKGRLIVLEGIDGSGKATQSGLLAGRLKKEGFSVEMVSFPRYESFFGKLVGNYLRGEFGSKESISPELSALLYSLDRFEFKPEMEKLLKEGKIVVCDRYSASNFAHQAAKFSSAVERKCFLDWIVGVESRLPEPFVTFFLDMPVPAAKKLLLSRQSSKHKNAKELDVHEQDFSYLEETRKVYLGLAEKFGWVVIECAVQSGREWSILPKEKVHSLVWKGLESAFK